MQFYETNLWAAGKSVVAFFLTLVVANYLGMLDQIKSIAVDFVNHRFLDINAAIGAGLFVLFVGSVIFLVMRACLNLMQKSFEIGWGNGPLDGT